MPSVIRGDDNFDSGQVIGQGQTWQNVLASRTAGVTYTNTTGKPIFVSVAGNENRSGNWWGIQLTIDDVVVARASGNNVSGGYANNNSVAGVVPNNSTYSVALFEPAYDHIAYWAELR